MSDERIKITISQNGTSREIFAEPGTRLRDALLANDASPYRGRYQWMNCGGLNVCGSCKVRVQEEGQWWERRSCQIRLFQDLHISIE